MKYITVLLFLAFFVLPVGAQQMISVIDDDTHDPIGNALFVLDGDTIAYTVQFQSLKNKLSTYQDWLVSLIVS